METLGVMLMGLATIFGLRGIWLLTRPASEHWTERPPQPTVLTVLMIVLAGAHLGIGLSLLRS